MTNGDGLPFCAGATRGELKLLPYGRHVDNIVEKRNIAKRGAHAIAPGGVVGDGGGRGPAIDVEEMSLAKDRHQLVHQRSVRSGL